MSAFGAYCKRRKSRVEFYYCGVLCLASDPEYQYDQSHRSFGKPILIESEVPMSEKVAALSKAAGGKVGICHLH
jgi:hypothetical protein